MRKKLHSLAHPTLELVALGASHAFNLDWIGLACLPALASRGGRGACERPTDTLFRSLELDGIEPDILFSITDGKMGLGGIRDGGKGRKCLGTR